MGGCAASPDAEAEIGEDALFKDDVKVEESDSSKTVLARNVDLVDHLPCVEP